MISNYQSLLNKFKSNSIGAHLIMKMEETNLVQRAGDLYQTLNSIISEGKGTAMVLINNVRYAIDGIDLTEAINTGNLNVAVTTVLENQQLGDRVQLLVDDVVDALANEFEVADLEYKMLTLLSAANPEVDLTNVAGSINALASKAVTSAGQALTQVLASLTANCISFEQLRTAFYSMCSTPDGSASFATPTIGIVTNTSGLALWVHDVTQKISDAIAQIKIDWIKVLSRSLDLYSQSVYREGQMTLLGLKMWRYILSTIWTDCYIGSSGEAAQHLAPTNGFITLGEATPELVTKALRAGLTSNAAIAIPVLGATFYIYNDSMNGVSVGLQKHLYDRDVAKRLVNRLVATGNTWADIIDTTSTSDLVSPVIDGNGSNFTDENEYNDYLCDSALYSNQLITAGLCLLSKRDIDNRYYQDADLNEAAKYRYMWLNDYNLGNVPVIASRADFINQYIHVSSTFAGNALTFACRCISDYLDSFEAGTISSSHALVSETLPGSFTLNDDAILRAQITSNVNKIVVGAVVIASVALAATAIIKLKGAARTAAVAAQRAITSPDVSLDDAKIAVRKANLLSKAAGVANPSLVPLSSYNVDIPSYATDLSAIKKLISG